MCHAMFFVTVKSIIKWDMHKLKNSVQPIKLQSTKQESACTLLNQNAKENASLQSAIWKVYNRKVHALCCFYRNRKLVYVLVSMLSVFLIRMYTVWWLIGPLQLLCIWCRGLLQGLNLDAFNACLVVPISHGCSFVFLATERWKPTQVPSLMLILVSNGIKFFVTIPAQVLVGCVHGHMLFHGLFGIVCGPTVSCWTCPHTLAVAVG